MWLCDERLPIVIRVDQSAGEVLGVPSWPIDDRLRHRPSIVDIDAGGDAVWVAAPNARGVVRLSTTLDHAPEVLTTAAAVGTVASCAPTCWARQETHGGEPYGSVGPNIWRITSEDVVPVDFGGFVWKLDASRTGAVALVQRPSRSHVEQPNPSRGSSWFYPG